jgi:hypothetical protein
VWPNRNIHCYVNWGSFWFISFVVANNVCVPGIENLLKNVDNCILR